MKKNRPKGVRKAVNDWTKMVEDNATRTVVDFTSLTMPLLRNHGSGILSDEGKKMIENFEFDCVLKRSKDQEELISNIKDEFSILPDKEKAGAVNKTIDIYVNVGSLDREFGQENKISYFPSVNDIVGAEPSGVRFKSGDSDEK